MMDSTSIILLKNALCLILSVTSAGTLTTTATSSPQTCEYNGTEYPVGTVAHLDLCTYILCNEPDIYELKEYPCDECVWSKLPIPPGHCCHPCPTHCEYDGNRYELDTYSEVDDCSYLYCNTYAETELSVMDCSYVDCPYTHKVEGECCPVCGDE